MFCCFRPSLSNATYEDSEKFVLPLKRGKVVKVYDGDTVTLAFYIQGKMYRTHVRLLGIDTPEIKGKSAIEKRKAHEARDALVGKILNQIVDLKQVGTEKYGRLLAEVWLGNENVCEWMLAQGHAVPYNGGTKTEQQWSS